MATLMEQGRERVEAEKTGPNFTPKDAREYAPEEQHDAIDRVVAAGVKLMYSPALADEREAAISSQEPISKRLADNTTGLMLMLDQKSKGGIPQEVLFPAACMLLNEVANIIVEAGQKVTQEDYNEALQIMYVQIGKKLGATDDQLMHGAEQALQQQEGGGAAPEEEPAEEPPAEDTGGAAPPAESAIPPAEPVL